MINIIKITSVKGGYDVVLSTDEILTVSNETKEEFLLYTGKELSKAEIKQMKSFDESVKPFRYAVNLLLRQSYPTRTIKDKLIKRKVNDKVIADVIKRLTASGLLNDEEYAKERAYYLINTKNAAKNAVIRDLKDKGINSFLIEDIIASYPDFEEKQLMKIVPKLLKRHTKLSHQKAKDRIIAKLIRDGFTYGHINSVLGAFSFTDYINEDENLKRDALKFLGSGKLSDENTSKLVYNKLSKSGYPHNKIKAILEGINYED